MPVGHPLMRCHRPALSLPFWPRQAENRESLSLRVVLSEQGRFQGFDGSVVVGQLQVMMSVRISACFTADVRWVLNLELNNAKRHVEG